MEGHIKTLTIRRTSTNKWYACFSVEINKELPEKKKIKNVLGLPPLPNFWCGGIDMGLTNFLTADKFGILLHSNRPKI